jgi:hypothetical protein
MPCDDDRQICDQRVSTMIRRAGRRRWSKRYSPASPWRIPGTASDQDVSRSGARPRCGDASQPKRVGRPVQHGQGPCSARSSAAPPSPDGSTQPSRQTTANRSQQHQQALARPCLWMSWIEARYPAVAIPAAAHRSHRAGRRQGAGLTVSRAGNAPGSGRSRRGALRARQAPPRAHGRLGAARAVWTSRVSRRVSSTLAGLRREASRR